MPSRSTSQAERNYGYPGPLLLSPGRSIGLRFVPMERDLRFAWEELPQQMLDEQAQKVRDSLRATLIGWARQMGEGSSYTDNLPMQCLHPVGHWYEVPNMLRNGTLLRLLQERPRLKYLMVHNIDTIGADVDPGLLGYHIAEGGGADHGGDRPAGGRPRRRAGARRWPRAPDRRPCPAQRGGGIAPFVVQQRDVLD